jgi:hypothetical protein
MAEIALRDRIAIKSILGIGLAKNSTPITVLRRLLDQMGYRLKCLRSESKNRKRIRVYGIVKPLDEREKVFQQWLSNEGQHPGQLQQALNVFQGVNLSQGYLQEDSLQLCLKF